MCALFSFLIQKFINVLNFYFFYYTYINVNEESAKKKIEKKEMILKNKNYSDDFEINFLRFSKILGLIFNAKTKIA